MSDSFGDYVVRRRKELQLTRQQLAERTDVSYPYVSQLETDKRVPSMKTLRALAEALEVPVSELAARMATDTWLMSATSLPDHASPSPEPSLERVKSSVRRRLADLPAGARVRVLTELAAEAAAELDA